MDVRHRLEYARRVRGKTKHQVFLRLKEMGRSVPNRTKRDVYAFFSETTRKIPPLPTLEALAFVLEVRSGWLAFGEGPMEAGVLADPVRELFLVDGEVWRFNPYLDPELRNDSRRLFHAAFRSAEGFENVPSSVQVVFFNYLARHFERCRENGSYQDDPAWRGQEAATQFIHVFDIIQGKNEPGGEGEEAPITAGDFLWALGSWEMQALREHGGWTP